MGRITKNFRQTKSAASGNRGAQNYAKINRLQGWHLKVLSYLKIRGKTER